MDEIILVGAGGHARVCIEVIEQGGQYKIAGLVEKNDTSGHNNLGYPIIGTDNDLANLRQKYEYALVTIGQVKSAATRVQLFDLLNDLEYKLPVIFSPDTLLVKIPFIPFMFSITSLVSISVNFTVSSKFFNVIP